MCIIYRILCYNEKEVLPLTAPKFKNKVLELIEKRKL